MFGSGPFGALPLGGVDPLWGTLEFILDAQLTTPNPRLSVLNSRTAMMVITVEMTPKPSIDRVGV